MKQQWVFGMLFSEFSPPRPIFYVVNNRSAVTLLRLICNHVEPGTVIYSDCFRSYCRLAQNGYVHRTVNHSMYFVDPVTGVFL